MYNTHIVLLLYIHVYMIILAMVKSLRGSNKELPAVAEFHQIYQEEYKLSVHPDKIGRNYPRFESVIDWMKAIGVEDNIFAREIKSASSDKEFFGEADRDLIWGEEIQEEVVKKTLENQEKIWGELEGVTEHLCWKDGFDQAEVALVYGGNKSNPLRARIAAELYKAGRVKKLLFTGRGPVWKPEDQDKRTEARAYADMAINEGVNPADIILEEEAITVADNGGRSLKKLSELGIRPNRIAVVTSWFCMRRAVGMLWKYVANDMEILAVPAISNTGNFGLDNWYKNPEGIRVIFNEFVKMRMAVDIDSA